MGIEPGGFFGGVREKGRSGIQKGGKAKNEENRGKDE
jgi:hypothetical protein